MTPDLFDFGRITRGDTSEAITLSFTDDAGDPFDFGTGPSARLQARDLKTDALAVEWSTAAGTLTISAGQIVIEALPPAATLALVPGKTIAELEVTLGDGTVHSYLRGPLFIDGDIAHD